MSYFQIFENTLQSFWSGSVRGEMEEASSLVSTQVAAM